MTAETRTYSVPGIHCSNCAAAIREEVSSLDGVDAVEVDLETKVVTIRGAALADETLRAAIDEAGYEVA